MVKSTADFILIGSPDTGGVVYLCKPGNDRNVWTAYDLCPGGELTNPRVVFGGAANWRGLAESA